jgi:hypothetical protein
LKALGFGQKWRDWVAAILATSSSRVLVNGRPSNKFKHAQGCGKAIRFHLCYSSWPLIPFKK